jgi:hypothetical protein
MKFTLWVLTVILAIIFMIGCAKKPNCPTSEIEFSDLDRLYHSDKSCLIKETVRERNGKQQRCYYAVIDYSMLFRKWYIVCEFDGDDALRKEAFRNSPLGAACE